MSIVVKCAMRRRDAGDGPPEFTITGEILSVRARADQTSRTCRGVSMCTPSASISAENAHARLGLLVLPWGRALPGATRETV